VVSGEFGLAVGKMMKVAVIGAKGFVGSAFTRLLRGKEGYDLFEITRDNYEKYKGYYDIVVYAASNSRKYIADENPLEDFEMSVLNRMKAILDYRAGLQIHISSVDVYEELDDPEKTTEEHHIDVSRNSNYGFHKYVEEQFIQHYSKKWLIFRLAGMVGPGLKKNPVYDILNDRPIRIHPESRYQYIDTDSVARIVWEIFERGFVNEIYNVCGDGLISPLEIAKIAGKSINLELVSVDMKPRIVDVCIEKIKRVCEVPMTYDVIKKFVLGRGENAEVSFQ